MACGREADERRAGPLGDGHTDLADDEKQGLRLAHISTRGELDAAEQANLLSVEAAWVRRRNVDPSDVLDDHKLRSLHKQMFGDVWKWAGKYRTTDRNIGIDSRQVAVAVRDLAGAATWWLDDGDRGLARFHHRLVAIHPFPNGNGRHARFATDLLARAIGRPRPTWGALTVEPAEQTRRRYISALRAADRDREDLDALVTFARS